MIHRHYCIGTLETENRDRIISRLWIISGAQNDKSRLILQTNLAIRVLYLITDPKRRKSQENETEGTRRVLRHMFGEEG